MSQVTLTFFFLQLARVDGHHATCQCALSCLSHIPCTSLSVPAQGHFVVAPPILFLGKLLASTDNVPYCFSGLSAQSRQLGLIYAVLVRVLKACYCAASIKPSVSFFKNPFLSHLQDSSLATSDVCWKNSPCKALYFHYYY